MKVVVLVRDVCMYKSIYMCYLCGLYVHVYVRLYRVCLSPYVCSVLVEYESVCICMCVSMCLGMHTFLWFVCQCVHYVSV